MFLSVKKASYGVQEQEGGVKGTALRKVLIAEMISVRTGLTVEIKLAETSVFELTDFGSSFSKCYCLAGGA